ncbi:peritrophin-1 [Solenopsis invicta]|uniref:peritrophin-1 n=1 Tax=Solenopsis invicta TaxID=13686 RepID=UPI000595CBD8|nr:peritrophin-1 [Solenopsis invicta]
MLRVIIAALMLVTIGVSACQPRRRENPRCLPSDTTTITEVSTNKIPTEANTLDACTDATCPIPKPDDFENILYPYYGNCTKFCYCIDGIPYVWNCPSGLHFNDNLYVCDWPQNVHCQY